jgi:molybdopterin biosynthesis enzyme MoaB
MTHEGLYDFYTMDDTVDFDKDRIDYTRSNQQDDVITPGGTRRAKRDSTVFPTLTAISMRCNNVFVWVILFFSSRAA